MCVYAVPSPKLADLECMTPNFGELKRTLPLREILQNFTHPFPAVEKVSGIKLDAYV